MDIRAYGKGFDRFIDKAKTRHDTNFINGRIASVESNPQTNDLEIRYITQDGKVSSDTFDLLVLSVRHTAFSGIHERSKEFECPA